MSFFQPRNHPSQNQICQIFVLSQIPLRLIIYSICILDGTAKSEHKKRIRELLKFIEKQKNAVFVFDEALVRKLLEKVTVYDDYLEFRFKSGVTVSVEK